MLLLSRCSNVCLHTLTLDETCFTNQRYDFGGIKTGVWTIGLQIKASSGKYVWHFEYQLD